MVMVDVDGSNLPALPAGTQTMTLLWLATQR